MGNKVRINAVLTEVLNNVLIPRSDGSGEYSGSFIRYTTQTKAGEKEFTRGFSQTFLDNPGAKTFKARLAELEGTTMPTPVVLEQMTKEHNGKTVYNIVNVLPAGTPLQVENQMKSPTSPSTSSNQTGLEIARSVGVKAAVDMGVKDLETIIRIAGQLAEFITTPGAKPMTKVVPGATPSPAKRQVVARTVVTNSPGMVESADDEDDDAANDNV